MMLIKLQLSLERLNDGGQPTPADWIQIYMKVVLIL